MSWRKRRVSWGVRGRYVLPHDSPRLLLVLRIATGGRDGPVAIFSFLADQLVVVVLLALEGRGVGHGR